MFFLIVCVCTMYKPGAGGGQKEASNPLGVELHTIVSHHVGAGNRTWLLWKSSAFTYWSSLQAFSFSHSLVL